MNAPTLASLAHTIAAMLEPRVIEAFTFTDEWRVLEDAGVGVTDIRHALDREIDETDALVRVRAWHEDGDRGTCTVHGLPDGGKSQAAIQWLRWQHSAGVPGLWISGAKLAGMNLDEIDAVITKVKRARALVWDDAGAAPLPGAKADALRAALVARWEGGWPTLITSNANRAQTDAWLGERLCSRVSMRGGFVAIESSLGYRDRTDFEASGRGQRWLAADLIVSCIGCKRESRWVPRTVTMQGTNGETWEALDGDYAHTLTVGGALVTEVGRRGSLNRKPQQYLTEICDRYGLDRDAIRAKATADDAVFEDRRAKANRQIDEVRIRRIREMARICDEEAARPVRHFGNGAASVGVRAVGHRDGPAWARGEGSKARLKALRFDVVPTVKGVKRDACANWRATFRDSTLGINISTEAGGWQLCAAMAGGYPAGTEQEVEALRARAGARPE